MTRAINPVALRAGRDFDQEQARAALARAHAAPETSSLLWWTAVLLFIGGAAVGWHLASQSPVYCTAPTYDTLPTGTTRIQCADTGRALFLLQ